MINELTVGKLYRITLRSRTFRGHLEGTLRATDLPAGAVGNEDGEHSLWFSGEVFEWFLRFEDIATIEELHVATAVRRPPCLTIRRAIRLHGAAAALPSRRARSTPEPFFRCVAGGGS